MPPENTEAERARLANLHREDLITFLNAAMVCTGQTEFYGDGQGQRVSIEFLHSYVLGNYRQLYARTLAAGINDFNSATVMHNLLRYPNPDRVAAGYEGRLIAAALHRLPPQRAYRLLAGLRDAGVCNRRTRRIASDYLVTRPDPQFHAVKYRRQIKQIVKHFHLAMPGEIGRFLFDAHRGKNYQTEIFDAFRRAHYSKSAIYELPFTIAEGLAARSGIDRNKFLQRIEPKLTQRERARLQNKAKNVGGLAMQNLADMGLTRLAVYCMSLAPKQRRERFAELDTALQTAASRAARRAPIRLPRLAVVLDNSYSTIGSRETHNRPLAIAVAAGYLLQHCSSSATNHWVTPAESPLLCVPRGHTDLATPLLAALGGDPQPELVLVVSDGHDNDPPGGAAQVAHAFRRCVDPQRKVVMLHINPTFDASSFGAKGIHRDIPMLGVRNAEDIPTMLAFARFVDGHADLAELEAFLAVRAESFVAAAQQDMEKSA